MPIVGSTKSGKSPSVVRKSDTASFVKKESQGPVRDSKTKNSPKTKGTAAKEPVTSESPEAGSGIVVNTKAQAHSTPLKQSQSHSTPPKQSHSHSPRKGTKVGSKANSKEPKESAKGTPVKIEKIQVISNPLPKLNVPPEEKADTVYKSMKGKQHIQSEIIKVENCEMYRKRGNLRPLRKQSHMSNFDSGDAESEETMEDTTEGEEEEEGLRGGDSEEFELNNIERRVGVRRKTCKEDVVHCACGDNVDEGFMIQVCAE